MHPDIIHFLTSNFEAHAKQTETGVEYWLARDLQHLLGYAEWRNFNQSAVSKAKVACEVSGHPVSDHFVDVNKTIQMPKGAEKEIEDILLTRYACYLIAQNGDPRKEEIAFAQTYFAVQTRRAELIEQRLLEAERVHARLKTLAAIPIAVPTNYLSRYSATTPDGLCGDIKQGNTYYEDLHDSIGSFDFVPAIYAA